MQDKIVITNCQKTGEGFANHYASTERDAIIQAGFEVLDVNFKNVLIGDAPHHNLQGKAAFLRHSVNQGFAFQHYARARGARLLVPDSERADKWYKIVPNDPQAQYWLGGRAMGCVSVEDIKYTGDEKAFDASVDQLIDTMFTDRSEMFIKAPAKETLIPAGLYKRAEARSAVAHELLIGGIHGKVTEVVYSEPMQIAERPTKGFKNREYRCLVVGDQCSTISIYSRYKRKRDYTEIEHFAQNFATNFKDRLPNSYCLDVARLVTGELAVVELNDIAATGFFADIDIYKFFADVYALAAD